MANKKYSVLAVLDVLRHHSDAGHPMLIKEIRYAVYDEYGIGISEKTIRSDIQALKSFGYDIRYCASYEREITHGDGTVLDSRINKDCYLVGTVSDTDIEILYDALLNDRFLSQAAYAHLTKKLESLSSTVDFSLNPKSAIRSQFDICPVSVLYGNMQILRRAIAERKVISFIYADPGNANDTAVRRGKDMCVSPCRVFAENGIYYLLGEDNTSGSGGGIVFLRINLMRNIQIEEQARYRIYKVIVEGLSTRDLAKRRFKTITGEDIEITFRFSSSIATETADYFGYKRMIFMPGGDEEHYTARIRMPGKAMLRYALMYAPDVEILAPQDLREQAAAVFRQAADVYGEG